MPWIKNSQNIQVYIYTFIYFIFKKTEIKIFFLKDLIDQIMKEDDHNKDGLLSYLEYAFSRRKEYEEERKSKN